MKLGTYLDQKGLAASRFAALIPVSGMAIHRYVSGTRIPRPAVMQRIIELTHGAVQPNDFFTTADKPNEVA